MHANRAAGAGRQRAVMVVCFKRVWTELPCPRCIALSPIATMSKAMEAWMMSVDAIAAAERCSRGLTTPSSIAILPPLRGHGRVEAVV